MHHSKIPLDTLFMHHTADIDQVSEGWALLPMDIQNCIYDILQTKQSLMSQPLYTDIDNHFKSPNPEKTSIRKLS